MEKSLPNDDLIVGVVCSHQSFSLTHFVDDSVLYGYGSKCQEKLGDFPLSAYKSFGGQFTTQNFTAEPGPTTQLRY
jgi:hypothetical protein